MATKLFMMWPKILPATTALENRSKTPSMELSKQALLSSLPSNYVNTLQTSEICENTLIIFGSEPGPGSELVVGLSPLGPPQGINWIWRPKRRFPALCPPKVCLQPLWGKSVSFYVPTKTYRPGFTSHLPGYTYPKSSARGRLATGRDFNHLSFGF